MNRIRENTVAKVDMSVILPAGDSGIGRKLIKIPNMVYRGYPGGCANPFVNIADNKSPASPPNMVLVSRYIASILSKTIVPHLFFIKKEILL